MENFNLKTDFGKYVFSENVMKKYLSKTDFIHLTKTIENGGVLDKQLAKAVASGIMKWATDNGATHFTHWFEPLTNSVAEKQHSFLRLKEFKKPILEFSGKELIKGETDASSFPSGNIRASFEARGYTVWDLTSPCFLRKVSDSITLCIPTAFISYGGEALDNKTPLLRSMEVINDEAKKLLKLFKTNVKKVHTMIGIEQEYFLIDKEKYYERKDIIYSGRTLFGAKNVKGQELGDHYSGAIRSQVLSFMKEVNEELWLMGVPAKTQHNEAAPGQFELACFYEEANVACDHNQLVMETLKRIASKHNMVCLLHEKPFKWVNGSGKHANWSIVTDKGVNLLNPGSTPHENMLFLLILSCVIEAVDDYGVLLRASCATPSKDLRLGANEAPPAIISCFVGDQLNDVIDNFAKYGFATTSKQGKKINKNIAALPELWLDVTDRNRTSPFAFTGNKFEFRMVGSFDSCTMPITVINTIVASKFAKATKELKESKDFAKDLKLYIKNSFDKHKKVIYSGDGYSNDWINEAKKRGLINLKSIVDAIPYIADENSVKLFSEFNILSENELKCREYVLYQNYVSVKNTEALTMIELANKSILPVAIHYTTILANSINSVSEVDKNMDVSVQKELLSKILKNIKNMKSAIDKLEKDLLKAQDVKDISKQANSYKDFVEKSMEELRVEADSLEMIVDKALWPMPSFGDLLFEAKSL